MKTDEHCRGCRDDFYNGHNNLGVQQCWNLPDAVMVEKLDVPIHMPPPYRMKLTKRPSCYRAKGFVRVDKNALDKNGYWKR